MNRHFMQIVTVVDYLHVISNPVFCCCFLKKKKKNNITNLLSAELHNRLVKVKGNVYILMIVLSHS